MNIMARGNRASSANARLLKWSDAPDEPSAFFFFLSIGLCCVAIFLFQLGTFNHIANSDYRPELSIVSYAIWIAFALAAVAQIARRPSILLPLSPLYFTFVAIALLTVLHFPIDAAGKSMIVSCAMIISISTILPHSGACTLVMRISAVAVAVTSASLLVEMLAPGTLSSVPGRSAGLFENPNVAGGALVLGGTATVPFVARRWRGPYAVLVAFGVTATISRTSLLVLAGSAIAAFAAERLFQRKKLRTDRNELARIIAAAGICSIIFAIALQHNAIVGNSFIASADTALTAVSAAAEASAANSGKLPTSQLSDSLGKTDSGAARLLLMGNAIHEISLWGVGIDRAHALAPHNQYIFFAVAFGVAGIIVAISLIGAIGYFGRHNPVFGFAAIGILVFTHDLTMLDLAVPFALGCAGAIHLGSAAQSPEPRRASIFG
ncbi:hypothetical protein LJR016_000677 [Devosia sp. LjRoot16]|uniref:hypothetical protein n=1 Tax=Devosia sp. LjRoot16 TaxID=3342271 RepID=UPI003ED040E2